MNTYLIYRGPSLINNAPILAFATVSSANRKTGNVVQTTIVPDNVVPSAASKTPQVNSVCGACVLKRTERDICYVRIEESIDSIARAYYAGNVDDVTGDDAEIAELGTGRVVRLGAYGDPAAVPSRIWRTLCSDSTAILGYTHQWQTMAIEPWTLRHCMLSCETENQAIAANNNGLRSYRVRAQGAPLLPFEIDCPEPQRNVQCEQCRLCDGAKAAKSVSIQAASLSAQPITWESQRVI